MKYLVALMLLVTLPCNASIDLLLGSVTYHYNRSIHFNETNELVGVKYNNLAGIYFKNSYYRDSYLLGYAPSRQLTANTNLGLIVGGVTGYKPEEVSSIWLGDVAAFGAVTFQYTGWIVKPTLVVTPVFVSALVAIEL